MGNEGNSFEILAEVLDKLIDAHVESAKVASDLKNAVQDNNEHLKELHELLSKMNAHFSNGFRKELKDHVSEEIEKIAAQLKTRADESKTEANKILKNITTFNEVLKSPKTWLNAFIFVGSLFGVIAAIVTVIIKYMG